MTEKDVKTSATALPASSKVVKTTLPASSKTAKTAAPKVALVIDWLDQVGGAEQVLLALHEMYPDAPIYTSIYRKKKVDILKDADIRTGWLNIFPDSLRKFLGPLRHLWFSHLNLASYDLVISVTGAEAKAVKTKTRRERKLVKTPSSVKTSSAESQSSGEPHHCFHLCYCHVPTQYYWQLYDDYLAHPGFGLLDPLARLGLKLFVKPMRKKDYRAAQQPDKMVTISQYAADQIKKYYNREAEIINPPVDLTKFQTGKNEASEKFSTSRETFSTTSNHKNPESQTKPKNIFEKSQTSAISNQTTKNAKSQTASSNSATVTSSQPTSVGRPGIATAARPVRRSGFVTTSRQVVWKRLDLCIKACLETGEPLTLIGEGPEHDSLVTLAKNSDLIQFFPRMSQEDLGSFLRRAKGYLFPSREPFGLAPVEALAAGCPVIAFGEGGALDYIEPGKNGLLFEEQTAASLASAIREFNKLSFSAETVKKSAARFDKSVFVKKIEKVVKENLHE